MKCARCSEEIPRGTSAWAEVKGWEQARAQGGTNHVALRKRTGRVMCVSCMNAERSGVSAGQLQW